MGSFLYPCQPPPEVFCIPVIPMKGFSAEVQGRGCWVFLPPPWLEEGRDGAMEEEKMSDRLVVVWTWAVDVSWATSCRVWCHTAWQGIKGYLMWAWQKSTWEVSEYFSLPFVMFQWIFCYPWVMLEHSSEHLRYQPRTGMATSIHFPAWIKSEPCVVGMNDPEQLFWEVWKILLQQM